ncbi:hypothetical protein GQ600_15298 [Phytophthora cactorum]|nr:hypothetical protein GQ600_15298 [Phytophthora cactorum]
MGLTCEEMQKKDIMRAQTSKRFRFCAICGELMRKGDDEGDGEGDAEKKKPSLKFSLLSRFRRDSHVQLAALHLRRHSRIKSLVVAHEHRDARSGRARWTSKDVCIGFVIVALLRLTHFPRRFCKV